MNNVIYMEKGCMKDFTKKNQNANDNRCYFVNLLYTLYNVSWNFIFITDIKAILLYVDLFVSFCCVWRNNLLFP